MKLHEGSTELYLTRPWCGWTKLVVGDKEFGGISYVDPHAVEHGLDLARAIVDGANLVVGFDCEGEMLFVGTSVDRDVIAVKACGEDKYDSLVDFPKTKTQAIDMAMCMCEHIREDLDEWVSWTCGEIEDLPGCDMELEREGRRQEIERGVEDLVRHCEAEREVRA